MITSVEKLKEWVKLNDAPYWILYKGLTTNEKVSEAGQNVSNLSMADSLARLDDVFRLMAGGRYTIKAKTKADDVRAGVYTETIDIAEGYHPAAIGSHNTGGGLLTKDDLAIAISKEKEKWEADRKIEKMQEEITALKKPSATEKALGVIVGSLEPMLTKWASQISGVDLSASGRPAAVGTIGFEERTEQATLEEVKRIQAAIEKLESYLAPKGMSVVEVLEKIANATETKPAMIDMALKML